MSTSKNYSELYPGQNVLISYLKERGNKSSYCGFLDLNYDILTASILPTDTYDDLNTDWLNHFLMEAKSLFNAKSFIEMKNKINKEQIRYANKMQIFWQKAIKEHKKENLILSPTTVTKKTAVVSAKRLSNAKVASQQYGRKETQENTKKITLQVKQNGELKKRVRDDDTDTKSSATTEHCWKKQSRILEQNKDNLVYRQVVDNALLVASAYESLIANDIMPFVKILKSFLLLRSQMSLSSANEPVLQAIVESLLPSKYCIPELSLVMNGKKPKGSGRFGYSDIFILSNIGDNNVCLELKYICLVGLDENQQNNLGANELGNLDKILEKENEESVLMRSYSYWSKEDKKSKLTTIGEVLNNGMDQLNSYMKIISKGKAMNYSGSGIFDRRVKITKSKPNNKLKGFVILVIGFHRILWRSADEITTSFMYNKIQNI